MLNSKPLKKSHRHHHHHHHHDKKDKKRRKEKKRHRKRSSSYSSYSSRSRSRSRSRGTRSRSRSRSRGRSSYHRRRRSRSRSRSYDYYRSDRDYYYGDSSYDKASTIDSYKYQEPNSTIMVRGMAPHLTEYDIQQELLKCNFTAKDIRLIRNRDSGSSRGFAFVEFSNVQEAIRWMDLKKGTLVLQESYQTSLIYSVPKGSSTFNERGSRIALSDWFCSKCQAHNFKRRELCYKCSTPKPEDADFELSEEISNHPTSTIILSNLDTLTTEDGILQVFQGRTALSTIPIRSVRVSREPVTNLSRGICYVETNNISDAINLHNELSRQPLEVDSRAVSSAYCKVNHSYSSNAVAAAALAAAQWTNNRNFKEDDIEKMAQNAASIYAKTSEEHDKYLEYYREYYKSQMDGEQIPVTPSSSQGSKDDRTKCPRDKDAKPERNSSSRGLAVSIPKEEEPKKSSGKILTAGSPVAASTTEDTEAVSKQSPESNENSQSNGGPDTERYQYDESSGYYFDPITELYYDPTTHYFYDPKNQNFLYWNAVSKQYTPVNSTTAAASTSNSNSAAEKVTKEAKNKSKLASSAEVQGSGDKVKVAKKVVKEMEKWARTLNQKKDFTKVPQILDETGLSLQSYSVKSGISAFQEQDESNSFSLTTNLTNIIMASKNVGLVAPQQSLNVYEEKEDSGSEEKDEIPFYFSSSEIASNQKKKNPEDEFVDHNKVACLLCKRQFPNNGALTKHVQFSELHKKNAAAAQLKDSFGNQSYRDRAKERRMKGGGGTDVPKNSLKDMYLQAKSELIDTPNTNDEPTRDEAINDDNIGNKMLQKMGWTEGQGLGRGNQGRTDIISAERRTPNIGLGMKMGLLASESLNDNKDEDRYKRARKLTMARYQELDNNE